MAYFFHYAAADAAIDIAITIDALLTLRHYAIF